MPPSPPPPPPHAAAAAAAGAPSARALGKAPAASPLQSGPSADASTGDQAKPKKKRHRAGRKHKKRLQSFAPVSDAELTDTADRPSLLNVPPVVSQQAPFYRIRQTRGMSDVSLDSEGLLDHRYQQPQRARRPSYAPSPFAANRPSNSYQNRPRPNLRASRTSNMEGHEDLDSDDNLETSDRTPLIAHRHSPHSRSNPGYGGFASPIAADRPRMPSRRQSNTSTKSGRRRNRSTFPPIESSTSNASYDVNNPPSMPGSPRLGGIDGIDDVVGSEFGAGAHSPGGHSSYHSDAVIDIDNDSLEPRLGEKNFHHRRRPTGQSHDDVCLPFDEEGPLSEEEPMHIVDGASQRRSPRARKHWPDFDVLEDWAMEEKDEREAKREREPELVGGRLRPRRIDWQHEIEDEPFRFTYYSDTVYETLRSHTLSGLRQLGLSFEELFRPTPVVVDEDSASSDEEEIMSQIGSTIDRSQTPVNGNATRPATRQPSMIAMATGVTASIDAKVKESTQPAPSATPTFAAANNAVNTTANVPPAPSTRALSVDPAGRSTPRSHEADLTPRKKVSRPIFWLDVLSPTMDEMRCLSRAFGIHKLTAEDIMEQESREKVELFRNYYFVNYRTFEQDEKSPDYMAPANMSFVVFKGGVISFHFSQLPHPPNVRRRIRQIREHQLTHSDWISYALIDNITDAYAPIIEQIERDVDDIDEEILTMHSRDFDLKESKSITKTKKKKTFYERIAGKAAADASDTESSRSDTSADNNRDMLLRVGECRKKVMSLYRLLGNKADVIKGLAKRCNEQYQVAPRTDVGLFLGDIQDHIVTMTGNLTHYENILSRAHSNYLAQINVRMNERAEQTNDVLGKLTILGTIVLPMNIVTGLFGSNFPVPGQDSELDNLTWFWGTTAFLAAFGIICYFLARRVYGPL